MRVSGFRNFLRRFRRSRDGSPAVEFALVAMPFFMTLFAIIDVSMVFFASTVLENGVAEAARQIRTGQAQAANMTPAAFRQMICDEINALMACDQNLRIEVTRVNGFNNINQADPATVDFNNPAPFQMGQASDIMMVRAMYLWPMLTGTGSNFTNMPGNKRLVVATAAFRNEPF